MHAHRSAIVARSHLHRGQWCVALVAESLADVWADLDGPVAIVHCGQRKACKGYEIHCSPVKERQRRPKDFLTRTGVGWFYRRAHQSSSFVVYLVTSEAGNRRLFRQLRVAQSPRTFGVEWGYQVMNSAVEVHAMTAQAIVHQLFPVIVAVVQKNLFIGSGVWTGGPLRILLLVAFLAAGAHPQHIVGLKTNRFGYLAAQVGSQAPDV